MSALPIPTPMIAIETCTTEIPEFTAATSTSTAVPWYHKLAFLDILPACHVNESTSLKKNAVSVN